MRVLVVEDEVDLAESIQRGLTAEGWVVDIAANGEQGWQLARTGAYAVIVLDLMLPILNGYQVCERLRRTGVDTPVLVLTAKSGDYDQTDALDGGADDFLTKPFRFPVLLARLRALVRRSSLTPGRAGDVLQVGDLELDLRRHRCRRGQTEIELTAREFALLEVLARRPDEVVSKRDILLDAWPGETDDANLVEVRVSSLRRKIDTPWNQHSLQTVRGLGYRLRAHP